MDEKVLALTDFRLAGFLVARRVPLLQTAINEKNEVVFFFNDEDRQATQCVTSFPGSPEQVYDAACKAMFDLVKASLRQGRLQRKE